VQGVLRTADATSPMAASTVLTSLVLFVIVYAVVFTMGIYYINRLIERGPQGRAVEAPDQGTPLRPLSSAHDAGREALASGS
jgi:cytochrome bd ubiquinol oxidase subunit I